MGNTVYKYIIVGGDDLDVFWNKANELFEGFVTNVVRSPMDSESFMIVPDGSKDGFETSSEWDAKRINYKEWFEFYCDEYNIYPPNYVEIHYCRDVDDYVSIMQSNESGWFR